MLRNFHIAALAKVQGQLQLFHIPLHQSLQDSLSKTWNRQLEEFGGEVEEIDIDMGYTPEQNERFRLSDFAPSAPLAGIDSLNIQNVESITNHEEAMESIRAIVAFCRDSRNGELLLFQNFTRSDVIQPGLFLLLKGNTYESAKRPGLTLDSKLSAVFSAKEKKLLFHNFRITNTFLPLAEFYEEASEEEISKILEHKALAPEDTKALSVNANQWVRKRFAMLRDSGVLDRYTPEQIKVRSKGYDVEIHIKNGKIVFPAENTAVKKLLQFLNEELYRGPITETLYETNSKRQVS
jgi:hypothetical protein